MLLPLLFTSCDLIGDNYGYPSKVTFASGGGIKDVSGEDCFYYVEILNYDGKGVGEGINPEGGGNDTLTVSYQWLTIKHRYGSTQLKVIAEPNHTGKRRRLYIHGMVDDHPADIKVVQH